MAEGWLFKHPQKEPIVTITITLLVISFLLPMINTLFYQELKGKISGKICFYADKVIIQERVIAISDIRLIKIEGFDFWGRAYLEHSFRLNRSFPEGMFSNGTDNHFTIILTTGEVIKLNFQKLRKNELGDMMIILYDYHKLGKLLDEALDHARNH